MPTSTSWRRLLPVLLLAGLLILTPVLAANDITISEIRIDQPGSDTEEFVELAGAPGTALDGLTYLVIGDGAGGSGTLEAAIDLSGKTIPARGFFVMAETGFTLGTADFTTALNFENEDNVTHLLVSGFSGTLGADLDTNDDGVLDDTPWTEQLDRIAVIAEENPPSTTEFHYGPPSVGPDGSSAPGYVFRCDDGWRVGPFDVAAGRDTPGAANACGGTGAEFGSCGDEATRIHDVQGSGAGSPLVDTTGVVIEGVVVGDFQMPGELQGFFVQEEDDQTDGDPQTSEGIFVYDAGVDLDVAVGDVVRVQGTVAEFFGLTELNDVTNLAICASNGTATAVPLTLPISDLDTWETLEGMLLNIPQTLTVVETYNLGRYGELGVAGDGRLFAPTHLAQPGTPANDLQAANALRRLLLDDGSTVQNPAVVPYLGPNNTLRAGDTLSGVTGVLSYGFSSYRLHPTATVASTRANARSAAPPDLGGRLTIASFNVLNYFTTLDTGAPVCGPSGTLDCRGANTADELARQRAKLVAALSAINGDVVGLVEIENNAETAVADLVSGLNATLGAGTFAYIDTGTIGTDAIKVALIYKPDRVTPTGAHAILDAGVDPDFIDTLNRPALLQTFTENATGERFSVVVNHLKSKGSSCAGVGDPDLGDGQGNCNLTRTRAAEALADWLAGDPTSSDDPDFLIIGDLNAYAQEDPIAALESAGCQNLLAAELGDAAYTYAFDGQAGYLDHALGSEALAAQVTAVSIWHINADEPRALDYNNYNQGYLFAADAYRSSDHDPVLVGLNLGPAPVHTLYLPLTATAAEPTPPPPDDETSEQTILTLIDQQRQNYSLDPLARAPELTSAARRHSEDMANQNFTDHVGSDASDAGTRMREAGYDWVYWGEIIGWGFGGDEAAMVAWWMNSAPHQQAILTPVFNDEGAGYAFSAESDFGHYWTVNFGRRAAAGEAVPAAYETCVFTAVGPRGGSQLTLRGPFNCAELLVSVE